MLVSRAGRRIGNAASVLVRAGCGDPSRGESAGSLRGFQRPPESVGTESALAWPQRRPGRKARRSGRKPFFHAGFWGVHIVARYERQA